MPVQAAGRGVASVQWGAWGGAGMALRVPGFIHRMARLGLGVLPPPAGLAAVAAVLASTLNPAATAPALRPTVVGEPLPHSVRYL